jgi:pilin isopeptide linkage protein
MDNNMGRKPTKERTARRRPKGQRLLALLLTLMMVLGSTGGMQIQADDNSSAASREYDITQYITADSTMSVYIDGKEYSLADLATSGKQVPEGAAVEVELHFTTIPNVPAGYKLVYQIPAAIDTKAFADPTPVAEANTDNTRIIGSFVIDSSGKITVTIDDAYHTTYANPDGTLTLNAFNLGFSGSFSSSAGQVDGSSDNIISFKGSASADDVYFTIPFDYKNYHANVQIDKTGEFNVQTRTISYTVTVTAPDTNTEEAYNVKVTDDITAAKGYVEADEETGNLYRNVTVTNGTFDAAKGIWYIDGNMAPGQTETLTYDLVVSKKYYTENTTPVANTATVTFNDNGKRQDSDQQTTPGTVLVEKKPSSSLGQDDIGTYVTYTVTVTAYGSTMSGVVVDDAFETPDMISSIVANSGYTGTVDINNTEKSLKWAVGTLAPEESQTLTYKAYLNAYAWQTASSENYYNKSQTTSKEVKNTATVSVNNSIPGVSDSTGGDPVVTDSVTSYKTIEKTWMNKTSAVIESGAHNGMIKFEVTANAAPSADNVVKIWDKLSGGTYEPNGKITLTAYDSSIRMEEIKQVEINIVDVLDDGSDTSWTINLESIPTSDGKTVNLSGSYYYKLIYYVDATGITSFKNTAGLGMGSGTDFSIIKTVQGSEGWSKDTDFKKESGFSTNYKTGETYWNAYIYKTVTEDVKVRDHTSTTATYKNGYTWFDDDCFDRMVITVGNQTLVRGVDYEIEGDTEDIQNSIPSMLNNYSGFYVLFLHKIEATKSNPIHISYIMKFDNTAIDESGRDTWTGNYFDVYYRVYGEWQRALTCDHDYVWAGGLAANIPLSKSDGKYDQATGTITWTIDANRMSTVGGDATLTDLLPEGLTFVSAKITKLGCLAEDNTHRKATTMNGKGINEEVTAEDCEVEAYTENGKNYTKVSLSLENLSAFECISGGKLVESTYDAVVGTNHDCPYGLVRIEFTAKVDPSYLATLNQATKITNKAILTGDTKYLPEGGVTATGDVTIPVSGSSVVSKSQVGEIEAPAYVQFALNINENAIDMMDGDEDVAIDDVMGEGMSLATSHQNSFKVYDVTNVKDLLDSKGKVIITQATTGKDITSQCSWTNVTTDSTKPTYRFTVPDATHVVIVYWASIQGTTGQRVSASNTANFYYEGKDYTNNSSSWKGTVLVQSAYADTSAGPHFNLQKQDQWGNNVSGAVFNLYEYNTTTKKCTFVSSRTTENGLAYIGHNAATDSDAFAVLSMNTIYKLEEVSSPDGYIINEPDHYFEFIDLSEGGTVEVTDEMIAAHKATHPTGITVIDISSGGEYTVTNTFTGADYQIPVAKTINGKNLSSTVDFNFTLKQESGDAVYTDEDYKVLLGSDGINATITGSGSTLFDTLYFKTTGTYTFTMTENTLSSDASERGYNTKDDTTYTVTVVVGVGEDKALEVTSVTFSGDNGKSGDIKNNSAVPTFNNTLSLNGTLSLQVKKVVSGRTKAVQAGEFSFTVTDNDTGKTVKDVNGNTVFTTEAGGMVNISFPITQDDIGTKRYIIREVVPADAAKDPNITYSTSSVIATVTIGEVTAKENGGTAGVKATSDVTYTASKKEDGVPLIVNEYHATGSITLTGTKTMTQIKTEAPVSINNGEFTFTVKEGHTTVTTGSTNSDGSITFDEITYIQSDVGEHTYTITEDKGNNVFVDYSEQSHTVKVYVSDNGDGTLSAAVTEVDGKKITDAKDVQAAILFNNVYTLIVPSGIRMDFLPYALVVLLAGGLGAATILRRRKQRKHHA